MMVDNDLMEVRLVMTIV